MNKLPPTATATRLLCLLLLSSLLHSCTYAQNKANKLLNSIDTLLPDTATLQLPQGHKLEFNECHMRYNGKHFTLGDNIEHMVGVFGPYNRVAKADANLNMYTWDSLGIAMAETLEPQPDRNWVNAIFFCWKVDPNMKNWITPYLPKNMFLEKDVIVFGKTLNMNIRSKRGIDGLLPFEKAVSNLNSFMHRYECRDLFFHKSENRYLRRSFSDFTTECIDYDEARKLTSRILMFAPLVEEEPPTILQRVVNTTAEVLAPPKDTCPPKQFDQRGVNTTQLLEFAECGGLYNGKPFTIGDSIEHMVRVFGPYSRQSKFNNRIYVWDCLGITMTTGWGNDTTDPRVSNIFLQWNVELSRDNYMMRGAEEDEEAAFEGIPKQYYQGKVLVGGVPLGRGMHIDEFRRNSRLSQEKGNMEAMYFDTNLFDKLYECKSFGCHDVRTNKIKNELLDLGYTIRVSNNKKDIEGLIFSATFTLVKF